MSSYYARRPLQSSGCSNSDSCWDGAPIEITESGPSVAGRLAALASRMTIKPLMTVGSYLSPLPLPLGFVDFACRVWRPGQGTVRTTINLPNATAQLVRAPGVRAADGAGRVVLYLHGGAFVMCGPNSHSRIVNALSGFAESPVLIVDYRLILSIRWGWRSTTATMHTNGCGRADTGRNRSCWPVIPRVVTLRSRLRSGCSATTRNRRQ